MARFFCIFHALSFELNFYFDRRFPLKQFAIWHGTKNEVVACSQYIEIKYIARQTHEEIF